jgi:hypothetical protein
MKRQYRFFFEWGTDNVLWPWSDEDVEISAPLQERATKLGYWYRSSVNLNDAFAPSLWRQEECDRFRAASRQLFLDIQAELADKIELIYRQREPDESPCLDEYLRDPDGFTRRHDPDCAPYTIWDPESGTA